MFIRRKKSKPQEVIGGNYPQREEQIDCAQEASCAPPRYEIIASLLSDTGCQRETNEDCGSYTRPGDSELLESKGWLAVVADGMGGHLAGEVASNLAVEVITRSYYNDPGDAHTALKRAFLEANRRIYESARKDGNLRGMGTTCTALALRNDSALYVHVGDSRLYMVRGGDIYLMTQDHSAVMEMVKHGLMSAAEARHHPDKNIILRALGSHPEIELMTWQKPLPVQEGDCFVLCSDGLYDLVEDEEIKQVTITQNPHAACKTLITMAKERGGHDNITVAVVNLKPLGFASSRPVRETRELEVVK
jgi:serine/threonine protein phosphatase PrpC